MTADWWLPRVGESGKGLRNFLRVLDVFTLFIVAMVSQLYKCHSVFCLLERWSWLYDSSTSCLILRGEDVHCYFQETRVKTRVKKKNTDYFQSDSPKYHTSVSLLDRTLVPLSLDPFTDVFRNSERESRQESFCSAGLTLFWWLTRRVWEASDLKPGQSGSTAHLGVELKGLWEEQQELFWRPVWVVGEGSVTWSQQTQTSWTMFEGHEFYLTSV